MSAEFVERFKAFWAAPDPAALGDLLHEDAHLVQPMMPEARSRAHYAALTGQLLTFIPDLRGTTRRWGETDDGVLIEHTLAGTLGGKPLRWDIADRITLRDGKVVERIAYFDPLPIAVAVLTRPRAWLPFLRLRLRQGRT
jgi:ketosteroid isomerase-like protein